MTSSVAQTNSIADIAVKWDNAYRNKDVDSLSALLAPDVVVHYAEGMGPEDKIESEPAVKSFLAKRLESVTGGECRVLADAINDDKRCSFSFWVGTGIKATGVETKTLPPKFSMWHVEFDESPRVKAIWLMTQPSDRGEEVTECPMTKDTAKAPKLDPNAFHGPILPEDKARSAALYEAAKKYGELWWTMDASRVPDHVAEDMVVYDLSTNGGMVGRDKIVEVMEGMKGGDKEPTIVSQGAHFAACTDQDKAFLWWHVVARSADSDVEKLKFGLSAMKIRDGKVTEAANYHLDVDAAAAVGAQQKFMPHVLAL
eukprot:CAMPEP_0206138840 /NCGR_PEP_ID=MMETSP1473-20131121/3722_1 /ASSEMBLY_ACC=CAM_ASM_001109 /TAXON_ID=1461547 /ORGANISM="Stichococcus sp, Strain RCC1054" /LENGTH=312 /DNA_ID=CAMNT_0053532367 /DNA_START=9 /DNA_END=948 /DNA_ORIENTATION=+